MRGGKPVKQQPRRPETKGISGKACPVYPAKSAALEIAAAQQEQIVEAALVLTGLELTVELELSITQRLDHFTITPHFAKDLGTSVTFFPCLIQRLFQLLSTLPQGRTAEHGELKFGGTEPGFELPGPLGCNLLHGTFQVVDLTPECGGAMVCGLQQQFLLMFQTLPDPQYDMEGESKCHGVRWRGPIIYLQCRPA